MTGQATGSGKSERPDEPQDVLVPTAVWRPGAATPRQPVASALAGSGEASPAAIRGTTEPPLPPPRPLVNSVGDIAGLRPRRRPRDGGEVPGADVDLIDALSRTDDDPLPGQRASWPTVAAWLRDGRTAATRRDRLAVAAKFVRWLAVTAPDAGLWQVTEDVVIAYRDQLGTGAGPAAELNRGGRGLAPATLAWHLSNLKSLYGYAARRQVIAQSPAQWVSAPEVGKVGTTPAVSLTEATSLVRGAQAIAERHPVDAAAVILLVCVGLRAAELESLTVGRVERHSGRWVIRFRLKGGKIIIVPLPEVVMALLAPLLSGRAAGEVLLLRDDGRSFDRWRQQTALRRAARAGGLEAAKLTPHMLRATAATLLLAAGVPVEEVQDLLGHASPVTTLRYDRGEDELDGHAVHRLADLLTGHTTDEANTSATATEPAAAQNPDQGEGQASPTAAPASTAPSSDQPEQAMTPAEHLTELAHLEQIGVPDDADQLLHHRRRDIEEKTEPPSPPPGRHPDAGSAQAGSPSRADGRSSSSASPPQDGAAAPDTPTEPPDLHLAHLSGSDYLLLAGATRLGWLREVPGDSWHVHDGHQQQVATLSAQGPWSVARPAAAALGVRGADSAPVSVGHLYDHQGRTIETHPTSLAAWTLRRGRVPGRTDVIVRGRCVGWLQPHPRHPNRLIPCLLAGPLTEAASTNRVQAVAALLAALLAPAPLPELGPEARTPRRTQRRAAGERPLSPYTEAQLAAAALDPPALPGGGYAVTVHDFGESVVLGCVFRTGSTWRATTPDGRRVLIHRAATRTAAIDQLLATPGPLFGDPVEALLHPLEPEPDVPGIDIPGSATSTPPSTSPPDLVDAPRAAPTPAADGRTPDHDLTGTTPPEAEPGTVFDAGPWPDGEVCLARFGRRWWLYDPDGEEIEVDAFIPWAPETIPARAHRRAQQAAAAVIVARTGQRVTGWTPDISSLRADGDATWRADLAPPGSAAAAASARATLPGTDSIHQLHLALREVDPPIWRRLHVPSTATLLQLHEVIQTAMGWQDYHLHLFGTTRGTYGHQAADESAITLAELLPHSGAELDYLYDFGDRWELTIATEKIHQRAPGVRYPRCSAGRRAAPPEDSGGPYGFADLARYLRHRKGWKYEQAREIFGRRWNPTEFDASTINVELAALNPDPDPDHA